MVDKISLRKDFLRKRGNLSVDYIQNNSQSIFKSLKSFLEPISYNNIMFYVPIKNEVDTSIMFSYFWKIKKTIYLPAIVHSKIVPTLFNPDDKLIAGAYNIPEPLPHSQNPEFTKPIDVVIVPCVACDKELHRLGYGKGYFDRFLTESQFKIGLAYNFQFIDSVPHEPHDIKLDLIITEDAIYS